MSYGEGWFEGLEKAAQLGHQARNESFVRQVEMACQAPGAPLPQAAQAMSDLMSLYRFVGNEAVDVNALRQARAARVAVQTKEVSVLLVAHDVTLLDYSGHEAKKDRLCIGNHRGKGYEYVDCVAIDGERGHFLGVVHDALLSAHGPDDRGYMDYGYEPRFAGLSARRLHANHPHQMAVHVRGIRQLLGRRPVIHLADREFDDPFLMSACRESPSDFIVRSDAARYVQAAQAPWLEGAPAKERVWGERASAGCRWVNTRELAQRLPLAPYKSVPVDAQGRLTDSAGAQRLASLSIGSCRVRLSRAAFRNRRHFQLADPVELEAVVVREEHPPAGARRLEWVLWTSLPVESGSDRARVAGYYEKRSIIEEFHRLLKSGYRIERARFDRAEKIARRLVIVTLSAQVLLGLKRQLGLPSHGPLAPAQHTHLREALRRPDDESIALEWRLLALIARQGGYLARRRDVPGPEVLMRGLRRLVAMLDALAQHAPLIEEARRYPQVLERLVGIRV